MAGSCGISDVVVQCSEEMSVTEQIEVPQQPRVISLFSGIGAFDVGFHQAGWETVYLCEWDKKAREVLTARFPGVPLTNDVREVKGSELPDAECIIFGSPCQDLSVAGKRGGLDGERSGLFREAIRVIKEMRDATEGKYPAFALLENVPGLLSSNSGRDFAAVIWEFLNCGARDVSWRVLDSQFFGVPQRRRRIFLVADFGGERAREILFESEGVRWDSGASRTKGEETPAHVGAGVTGDVWPARVAPTLGASWGRKWGNNQDFFSQKGGMYVPDVARCLTTRNQRNDAETENLIPVESPTFALALRGREGGANLEASKEIGYALRAGGGGSSQGQFVAHPVAFDYKASVQRNPMCGPVSPTLEAQDKTAINTPDYRVRRLTPNECEKLQGLEPGWTFVNGMPDTHRYRFIGNAGAVPVLKWIALRMRAALHQETTA